MRAGGSSALLLLLALTLWAGCAEDENPLGFDNGGRLAPPAPLETTLVVAYDEELRSAPATDLSESILVGSNDRLEAAGFLRFAGVPDTAGVDRSYLRIHLRKGWGGSITLTLWSVEGGDTAWTPSTLTWGNRPTLSQEPLARKENVKTGALQDTTIDVIDFDLPVDLIRSWKADEAANAGLALTAESVGAGGVARIVSHNDLLWDDDLRVLTPSLNLVDTTGTVRTVTATGDAYALDDRRDDPVPGAPLAFVSSGTASRFLLRFDLSAIPREAAVVRATIRLRSQNLDVLEKDPFVLGVYEVADTANALKATATDLSESLEDSVRFEIGALAQKWVEGEENLGVVVRAIDEVSTLESVEIHTGHAASESVRPALRVVYLLPSGPRWSVEP
ncbi:MAG: hypothetical protein FJY88_04875 [Candidatus Eisenbacteria bacterium]|nr:hypothetical protein [Candidatus Eisenbacteria bacterium]